jgi:hypothetical protein
MLEDRRKEGRKKRRKEGRKGRVRATHATDAVVQCVTTIKWKEQRKRSLPTKGKVLDPTYLGLHVHVSAGLYEYLRHCQISAASSKVQRRLSVLECIELDVITEEGNIDIFVSVSYLYIDMHACIS